MQNKKQRREKSKALLFQRLSSSLEESSQISQEIYQQYLKKHSRVLLLLKGTLGAGKTFFVRSLGKSLGIRDNISSPSFNLLNTYTAPGLQFFHYDLYRLQNAEELEQLDFRERWSSPPDIDKLDRSEGKQMLHLIEWPELALSLLPQEEEVPAYCLHIQYVQHIQEQDNSEAREKRLFQLYKREEA